MEEAKAALTETQFRILDEAISAYCLLRTGAAKRFSDQRASRRIKVSKLWNHLKKVRWSIDRFSNLVDERRRSVTQESRSFTNVHNAVWFKPHQAGTGLGQQRLALVVGNIVGKGIAAALLMANLQAILRSQCAIAVNQPHQMLQSVKRHFYENTAESVYATIRHFIFR